MSARDNVSLLGLEIAIVFIVLVVKTLITILQ